MGGKSRAILLGLAAGLAMLGCGASHDGDEGRSTEGDPPDTDTEVDVQDATTAGPRETSVVFGAPDAEVADLETAVAVLTERLELAALDGAEVRLQGTTIVVELANGNDLEALTQIAEAQGALRLRPVLAQVPLGAEDTNAEIEAALPVTPPAEDTPDATVTLKDLDESAVYQLGPMEATGEIVDTAEPRLGDSGQWEVSLVLRTGADGVDLFNSIAARCATGDPTCPTGRLAIVVDSVVQVAPTIQQESFARDEVVISGSFSESEARHLALVLRSGALPFRLERQVVQTTQ